MVKYDSSAAAHFGEPLFFCPFVLMKWEYYGIMICNKIETDR